MVPGVFKTVIPFLSEIPLRCRICASYPIGSWIKILVLIRFLSKGFNVTASSTSALKSIPAVNENLIKIRSSLYFYFDSSLFFYLSVVCRFLYFWLERRRRRQYRRHPSVHNHQEYVLRGQHTVDCYLLYLLCWPTLRSRQHLYIHIRYIRTLIG